MCQNRIRNCSFLCSVFYGHLNTNNTHTHTRQTYSKPIIFGNLNLKLVPPRILSSTRKRVGGILCGLKPTTYIDRICGSLKCTHDPPCDYRIDISKHIYFLLVMLSGSCPCCWNCVDFVEVLLYGRAGIVNWMKRSTVNFYEWALWLNVKEFPTINHTTYGKNKRLQGNYSN